MSARDSPNSRCVTLGAARTVAQTDRFVEEQIGVVRLGADGDAVELDDIRWVDLGPETGDGAIYLHSPRSISVVGLTTR